MSYYDRLQKVAQEQGINKNISSLSSVKSQAEDSFNENVGNMNQIASGAIRGDLKVAGRHIGIAEAKHLGSKYLMKPAKQKLADSRTALDNKNEMNRTKMSGETDEITERGMGRLGTDADGVATGDKVENAYRLTGSQQIVGESHPYRQLSFNEPIEGKVVPKGNNYTHESDLMDNKTGLRGTEDTRLGEIADTAKASAGEEIGGAMSKISKIGDVLGPVGEVVSLGMMLGEGIKNAVDAHREQGKDLSSEHQNIGASQQSSQYMGMSRPSFGSMALPSFDTSKSSAMLQQ